MKLYISGPMTGRPDLNYPAFNEAATFLQAHGFEVSNPATYPATEGETWEACLRRDLVDLLRCDGVATLPGWTRSRGARFEVRTAKMLRLPVHSVLWWVTP